MITQFVESGVDRWNRETLRREDKKVFSFRYTEKTGRDKGFRSVKFV